MSLSVMITKDRYLGIQQFGCILSLGVLAILTFAGCRTISLHDGARSEPGEQQVFDLKHVGSEQCIAFLWQLGLGDVSEVPEANSVLVTGSPEQLRRAALVLDLVDAEEDFVIENLGPASTVRTLPSNSQIAAALGDIRIGTFTDPPQTDEQARGIIDIEGGSVIAILPARHREQLLDLLTQPARETVTIRPKPASSEPPRTKDTFDSCTDVEPDQVKTRTLTREVVSPDARVVRMPGEEYPHTELVPQTPYRAWPEPSFSGEKTISTDTGIQERTAIASLPDVNDGSVGEPKTLRIILEPAKDTIDSATMTAVSRSVELQNGEDILDLALPETMTLMQLLDLVGEYLDLDYVYDPVTVGKQSVALKLHGSLQGEIKIKDLYVLLETVLKFKGLAMIRREDKLVTIVPVSQVLDADPQLVDVEGKMVQAGDIVVTRIFELRYVDVTSVTKLLQNMKLGLAVSPSEGTRILFVTCYAHRMGRIEQLVNMLDRPGRPRECRFRRLQYTVAPALADKVRTLAQELQGIPVTMASATGKSSSRQGKGSGSPRPGQPVYLDTDERTNRILMIGHEEQLGFIEELVDALDVGQEDLRVPKTYDIRNMEAHEALGKLQELEVLGPSTVSTGKPRMGASGTPSSARAGRTQSDALTEEPIVVVLEATNQLLIKATREQHACISEFLGRIDVSPEDLRTLRGYEIKHVDAEEVRRKLEELNIIGVGPATSPRITTRPGTKRPLKTGTTSTAQALVERPQVVVTESTNSLLVNATAEQHAQIATIINYVDSKMPEEEILYKIYPLENSSPGHVENLLEQLIQETVKDKEGKIEKVTESKEQITIVPDPNTFSLIVYASGKNQEWIGNLIKSLDKRRPQVLIDVTLVEITRMDTFEYDLNIVASAKEAVIGNIGINPLHEIDRRSRIEGGFNLLDQEGNPTGRTKAFYSDDKVQALLTAIKRKNYGRVLAKPKILVDDGQQGQISTTDETTYVKESIQIPEEGTPITTRDFVSIQAMIQLQITPHISEGDLLRLDVHLSRDDFGTRPVEGAPPDKASSEITTTVFVPDNHTVILGGLVKLNQSKEGSKVPILGDIPLIGGLFRSVDNSDVERKLYVFLKANIVRPSEEARLVDLQKISEEHRKAFEKSEAEFQKYEDFPGITPEPMRPARVLEEL